MSGSRTLDSRINICRNIRNTKIIAHIIRDNNFSVVHEIIIGRNNNIVGQYFVCLLYTSPSPRDEKVSRMPSSA